MPPIVSGLKRYSPSNCELPLEGIIAVKTEIVFDETADVEVSLFELIQNQTATTFQTLYYYNDTPNAILAVSLDTDQKFAIPANSFGYMPILITKEGRILFKLVGDGRLEVHFINVPIYPINNPIFSLLL